MADADRGVSISKLCLKMYCTTDVAGYQVFDVAAPQFTDLVSDQTLRQLRLHKEVSASRTTTRRFALKEAELNAGYL